MSCLRRLCVSLGPARNRVAGSAVLVLSLLLLPGAAAAAPPQGFGYWWRAQTGVGPPLPHPPTVPAGGLWVAGEGSGQHALSAIRYVGSAGEEIQTLVLSVNDASGSVPVLLACPAASPWQPVEAGAWPDRPQPACNVGFANGVRSADGNTWSFDVRGLARSGTLDVVVLSPPDQSAIFSVSFARPGADAIVTRAAPGSPSPSASPSQTSNPAEPRTPSPSAANGFAAKAPTPSTSSFIDGGSTSSPAGSPLASAPRQKAGPGTGRVALIVLAASIMTATTLRYRRARRRPLRTRP